MKASVVICSVGRPEVLEETVVRLSRQRKQPEEIVVSVVCDSDVTSRLLSLVKVVFSPNKGSSVQRNYGVSQLSSHVDLVVFLDDDVELCSDYIEQITAFFESRQDYVAISGRVVKDGGISREDSIALVEELEKKGPSGLGVRDTGKHWILYGCNMAIRRSLLDRESFDEALPLYSFAEDYDISIRAARWGKVGRFDGARAVHLQVVGGRVSEFRRGYSMVANNFYFLRKGVCHLPLVLGYVRLLLVLVIKEGLIDFCHGIGQPLNCSKSLKLDFLGRFKGRMRAVVDILSGRCHPKRILEFSQK